MKKILSLALAGVMMFSALPVAYATTDVSNGTQVSYVGSKTSVDEETGKETYTEAYTVTVPAQMAPGATAYVKAEGTWNSARKLVVSADESVVLKNSINAADTKELAVTFATINLVGDNNVAVANYVADDDTQPGEAISVANIENALFGTWSGTITYEAGIVDVA